METLCPSEVDRASEVSFCLEEDVSPETVLNSEEAEDLTQSFKKSVNTEEVKPKLQCLMSNPAFSMVTVQCEDSGIHWETSSSRCSTPWASEASTTSDVYSMDGSSAGTPPGKVIFIMDEGKLRRKRVRPSTSAKFPRQSSHHKKSTENPKASADNMGESFKQALEKAKRHLSTHTEEAGNADSSTKDTEDYTGENLEPGKDSSSENKAPDEKTEPFAAETSHILPDKVAEEPTSAAPEPDKMPKQSELENACGDSAMCPTKNVPEKQSVTKTLKQTPLKKPTNTKKPKGRIPQSLVENKPEIVSSKHDIDSYPPFVLVELSTVLENINKLCNPEKVAAQEITIEPPSEQSDVFSIVSDGSEILNILAPDLISTVDQEASKEMEDKLEYLEENPLLIPKLPCTENASSPYNYEEPAQNGNVSVEEQINVPENIQNGQMDKAGNDIDYFEKFTLVDSKVPIEPSFKSQEPQEVKVKGGQHTIKSETSIENDYYLLQSLDESFYGVSLDDDAILLQQEAPNPEKSITDKDTEKNDKDVKTNGVSLFSSEEGVLTKSFFFPTSYPVNHELLEEPPALAFLYSDLYEQARGCKAKEEHDRSDAESTSSAQTFHSRISDDDGTGIYFEKFNLKDEIPAGGEKSDEEDFYSDEGSEEEQYLSYEALSQGSLGDKDMSQNEIILEDNKSYSPAVKKSHGDKQKVKKENQYETKEIKSSHNDEVRLDDQSDLVNDTYNVPATGNKLVSAPTEGKNLQDEENAEDLDYVIVSTDDLDDDDISLKEIAFEDQDSLGHGSDLFLDAVHATAEHEEPGFEVVDQEKKSGEILETPLSDEKRAQIDTYCNTCKIPIIAIDKVFGDHKDHDVTALNTTVNEMTSNLENLLEKLQESSLKTEDFVTRVEALFNEVEKNCTDAEKHLTDENEKTVQKIIDKHKKKREGFEEVKKMKMDYLYDQMVGFQQSVDTAKEILERAAKELDELDPVMFLSIHNDINSRLLKAIENTVSLDKMPTAFSLFDHIAAQSTKDDQKTIKHLPVPQTPKLKLQEHNSATCTSITVYWTISEEDVIDCFQVYCMEEPQGKGDDNGLLEEYRVTVKESFCILEDLEADKCYSVWVMAVNYTGCSMPSDKSIFRTAPSTPVIKAEECTVCWDTAVIRWSTSHHESTESFTLEWCKQYSSEGEGLRSVAGIKDQQLRVSLQPGENYFFYVKGANTFGSSEQSEAALISTKGTRFHLLRDTAHPAVELSPDGTVISIAEQSVIVGIPLVLGELLPAKGQHYWEMMVTECSSYSVGATFHPSPEESATTEDSTSWCMQCSSSSTSFSYRFLHNEIWSEVHLTEPPVRVGILLDYRKGRLSFYNVQKGQLLFTFRHTFTEAAHPTFALEAPGEIHLHTGIELPQFTKQS
ncbi:cardiomyopathy-associated protein 5 isoform X1 [Phyllobates terribilis]|uniref:cardiomyopathy-associated protein 5 isoform X1 n=1 Tax=Phyllobates terribilis TaxID=111132 RepID=UPI003CCA9600